MPPTAEATTGFFFHSASETVSPKPSRKLFCMTTVAARCSALTSSGAQAGSSSTLISGSQSASRNTSFNTMAPSGSSDALPPARSEEHTSELQSQSNLVCRLLLEKKKKHISIDNAVSLTSHLAPAMLDAEYTVVCTPRRHLTGFELCLCGSALVCMSLVGHLVIQ